MPLYDKNTGLSKSSRAAGDIQICHECMGEKVMKNFKCKMISWNAPIVPSISMAGIELGMDISELLDLLSMYTVDGVNNLYQFEMSPVLHLVKRNSNGDELYLFNVHDKDLTNWRLYFNTPDHLGANPRALGVVVRDGKVHSVKAWNFEKLKKGDIPKNIYRGKLPENIGLGDQLCDLLPCAKLVYNDADEVFYSDSGYGAIEVTGYGELDEYPDQVIMAISLISESIDQQHHI